MRESKYDVMKEIKERWSPRAFSTKKVTREDLLQLIEAAHFAPSSFNEQPWRFVLVHEEEDLARVKKHLKVNNQIWNENVTAYIGVLYKKNFTHNDKPNRFAPFDTGNAWGLLSIEAIHMGMHTHAMAGFEKDDFIEDFKISDDFDMMALVAVGYYGDKEALPEALKQREQPNVRKELEEIIVGE